MPRLRRWQVDGELHHIIFKGHNGDPIVSGPNEADELLGRLGDALRAEALQAVAVAVLTNHGHIEGLGRIERYSRALRMALSPFAQGRNVRLRRSGSMFTNRFWSRPVETDSHAFAMPPYVLLNPRKAGLVRSVPELREYRWCSYGHTFHGDPFPVPIDLDALFQPYAQDPESARRVLRELLDDGEQRWIEDLKMQTLESLIRVIAQRHGVPEAVVRSGSAGRWESAARADIILEVRRRRLPITAQRLACEVGISPRTVWRLWRTLK